MKKIIKNIVAKILNRDLLRDNQLYLKELLWAETFNRTIADILWLKNKSFSPGRWAVGYPGLYILVRAINNVKPKSILEFGLGESSKLSAQYVQNSSPETHLTIVEHDVKWINFFLKKNSHLNIKSNIKQLPLKKLTVDGVKVTTYKDVVENLDNMKYDFIFVDGPFGSEALSRPQILDIIQNGLLSDKFVIIIDDANRNGEMQTITRLKEILHDLNIKFSDGTYSGLKDSYIICHESYSFLTSL